MSQRCAGVRHAGDEPGLVDEAEDDASESEEDQDNPDAQGDDPDDQENADAAPEQSQDAEQDPSQAQVTADELADMEMGEETELPEGEAPLEPPPRRGRTVGTCSDVA